MQMKRGFLKNSIIFIGDFVFFFLSLYLVLAFRYWDKVNEAFLEHFPAFFFLFFVYQLVLFSAGFWDKTFVPSAKRIFDSLLPTQIIATILMGLFFYAMPVFHITPKTNLAFFSILLFFFIFSWKLFSMRILHALPQRALFLGKNFDLKNLFPKGNLWNIEIVKEIPNTKSYKEIRELIEKENIDTVITDVEMYPRVDVLYKLLFENIQILDLKDAEEEIYEKIDITRIDQLWFVYNIKSKEEVWSSVVKRFLDIVIAIPIFILFLTVYPFVAYFIKKEDGGRVIVSLPRVGKKNKVFNLKKFRSMPENLKNGETKITKVGKFLRKTSLDELPQVLSVLKGEMSFVGPRPEKEDYVKKYSKQIPYYSVRHLVLPGITGWAQIKQRSAPHHNPDIELTKEKLSYDLYYIKKHSIFLYIKIVLKTAKIVFNRTNYDM